MVTAQPPPLVALAPLLRGLLSVSKLSLGSGTAKSQRSGRCLPRPLPQRQPVLGDRKERGQGRGTSIRVFKFHEAHPPRKRHLQEAETMPLMSQHSQHPTSQARTRPRQKLPTPRQCRLVSPGPEWETGSGGNQKCSHLRPSLNSHRRDNMASTGAVVAVMVLSLALPASQDGGHHSTQWAKKGCYAGRWPA